jgi:tRNA-dihydrouridine synthase 3
LTPFLRDRQSEGGCLARRYSKLADWDYIRRCAAAAPGLQLIGNGDVMSFTEYNEQLAACPYLATVMLARGALVKPWLFTEVGCEV